MKWNTQNPTGLIGLHRANGKLHLAAVQTRGDGVQTVSSVTGEGDAAALLNRLNPDVRDWPIAITLPTEAGLHRPLELPAADDASTQKMIALRLEGLYPVQDASLQWGWKRDPANNGRAWIYFATSAAVERNKPKLPPGNPLAGAVSQEMAMIAQVLAHDPKATLAIVTSTEQHAGVTVLADGKLHAIQQADLEEGDEAAQVNALDEALNAATEDLPAARRPRKLLIVGPAAALADQLRSRWDMQRVTTGQLLGEGDEGKAVAVGAATAALCGTVPTIAFEHDHTMSAADRRHLRRRVIQAACWLVAALVALVAVDLRNASVLRQEQIDSVMSQTQRGELDRDRVLGLYIQSLGPTPLAIIDEIGLTTKNIQLDNIQYDANGDFRLRGTLSSTEQVNELVKALSKMQTLEGLSLVNQRKQENKVEFEIVAKPKRGFFGAFAAAPAPAAASKPPATAAKPPAPPPEGGAAQPETPVKTEQPVAPDTTIPAEEAEKQAAEEVKLREAATHAHEMEMKMEAVHEHE